MIDPERWYIEEHNGKESYCSFSPYSEGFEWRWSVVYSEDYGLSWEAAHDKELMPGSPESFDCILAAMKWTEEQNALILKSANA